MKDFFLELLEYNHQSNQKLTDVFTSNSEKTSEKAIKLFSHILDSHSIWNGRISPPQSPYAVWQIQATEDFHKIDQTNYEQTQHILNSEDLNQKIQYTTSTGLPFTNTIRDIVFHVLNHSTYHRAQIATEFKNNGMEPLATDYILFKR